MSLRVRGCADCLRKAIEIDKLKSDNTRLRKENARLRKQLGKEHRQAQEAPFGSSTPSSKLPHKPTSQEDNRRRQGGGQPGHRGHGRRTPETDEPIELPLLTCCPDCGGPLVTIAERSRTVLDARPLEVIAKRYSFARCRCCRCGRFHEPAVPGVLPKNMLSNALLSVIAVEHYLYGLPMGQLVARTNLSEGTLFNAMHRLANLLEVVPDLLAGDFRQAACKHADETPWRIDGANGYSWFFGNADNAIFRFVPTRAGSVVASVLGDQALPGALVVDRYGGYNASPCKRQFCYAHLLRDLTDLAKEFPDNTEVATFIDTLAPLLADAMHLPGKSLADADYYREARRLKKRILKIIDSQARHFAVQNYQNIFREHRDELFCWVDDRRIPPDNNFAERALRPTVIARKISFGSQSLAGASTRGILMTTLHTLAARGHDPAATIKTALDAFTDDPQTNLADFLFPAARAPG